MTTNAIAIGCQQHSPKFWKETSDESINAMHYEALLWWKDNKDLILETYQKHF